MDERTTICSPFALWRPQNPASGGSSSVLLRPPHQEPPSGFNEPKLDQNRLKEQRGNQVCGAKMYKSWDRWRHSFWLRVRTRFWARLTFMCKSSRGLESQNPVLAMLSRVWAAAATYPRACWRSGTERKPWRPGTTLMKTAGLLLLIGPDRNRAKGERLWTSGSRTLIGHALPARYAHENISANKNYPESQIKMIKLHIKYGYGLWRHKLKKYLKLLPVVFIWGQKTTLRSDNL